jgi:amylosucrase
LEGVGAARRHDPASVEGRLWAGLRRLIAARRATRAVHAQTAGDPFWTGNDHVFGLERSRAGQRLTLLANFTPERQAVHLGVLHDRGVHLDAAAAVPDGRELRVDGESLVLEPYQFAWLDD